MEPQIRYCTSADGTRVAYAFSEEGRKPPLLFVNFMFLSIGAGRVGVDGSVPTLAAGRQHVRLDRRGIGYSQRSATDFSLDAQVADVLAVANQVGIAPFDVMGFGDGCLVAAAFAAHHPGLVRRLVLSGPTPTGRSPAFQSIATMVRSNWSLGRGTIADIVLGGNADPERRRAYIRFLAEVLSPATAASYLEATWDPGPALASITAPTLVVYPKRRLGGPIEASQMLAAGIPGARFSAPAASDLDQAYFAAVREFFGDEDVARESQPSGRNPLPSTERDPAGRPAAALRTVLFTDIVGHTEMMQRLGDAKGRDVLREHERITRDLLKQHDGAEVKTMGDGFMASFGSVTSAVDCAIALQRAFSNFQHPTSNIQIRVGLNAGEPIEEDGDLFGATVILASRIAAQAAAGEILVPDTVRGLLSGKNFLFSDRGEFVPKGFDESVRLWDVRWQPGVATGDER